MHPEPNEISQKDSLDSSVQGQPRNTQHGSLQIDSSNPCQPSAAGSIAKSAPLSIDASGSDSPSEVLEESSQGLRSNKLPPFNSENAVSKHVWRSNVSSILGKSLETKELHRQPQGASKVNFVSIADLPNEVLTHVLSHLPPAALSTASLISKRFNQLVTTPHAWRSAFSRYFPGPEALATYRSTAEATESNWLTTDRRAFTRLTSSASWRSEYILRTRLLRSLARGRPNETTARAASHQSRNAGGTNMLAQVTYTSNLPSSISHIHSTFGSNNNKASVRFIHGSAETGMVSMSDPRNAKTDRWGFQDALGFRQFSDLFPGDELYGLGPGECVGVPNCMDVSQDCGMIYGEGHELDSMLWFRHADEKRGRALLKSSALKDAAHGIPQLTTDEAICAVWIAKGREFVETTKSLIGMLAGTSTGVLTAYSLGTSGARTQRLERGQITARWALCPGVPIIAISVDEHLSPKRLALGRTWLVVLNALGELYYLTSMPTQREQHQPSIMSHASAHTRENLERQAWATGRSVGWRLVYPTKRTPRSTPFGTHDTTEINYPQLALRRLLTGSNKIKAETKKAEEFLRKKPKDFRKIWQGWDMRRHLHTDFAATDQTNRGEIVVIATCGLDEAATASVKCFARHDLDHSLPITPSGSEAHENVREIPRRSKSKETPASVFGGGPSSISGSQTWSFANVTSTIDTPHDDEKTAPEAWRSFNLSLDTLRQPQITASAIDSSNFALLPSFEDFAYAISCSSASSTPLSSPSVVEEGSEGVRKLPGGGARLLAIGTKSGRVLLYNIRAVLPAITAVESTLHPLRIVVTDSPQISCLALNALYFVHGGNDGLVQAWDPLASSTGPIRTLNSRFSSRARRRLVQAEASPAGVGINLFAAGSICLDPDPTVLRGMVSLGSHLRFWSYSSNAAEQYKSSKRRLRRSERGSNQGADRFSGTGRGALRDYIANEKQDLEREKKEKRKEAERLAGRFGLGLLGPGASEDEIMAYATMLSEEAAHDDALRRESASSSSDAASSVVENDPYLEQDDAIAEAIHLSLQQGQPSGHPSSSAHPDVAQQPSKAVLPIKSEEGSQADPDLEYAMQLSLAEHESSALTKKGKEREV